MALTQEQWFNKIKTFAPSWFWEKEEIAVAWAQALAKSLTTAQTMVGEHVAATFIIQATADTLAAHGGERSLERLTDELDGAFAVRIQNLLNQSNVPSLKAFIDKVLIRGTCRIQEDFDSVPFLDRENFFNRASIFLGDTYHSTFSVVVDKQIHDPFSFTDREFFLDREEAYLSTSDSLDAVFALIVRIVNDNKALGTFYRIIERLE